MDEVFGSVSGVNLGRMGWLDSSTPSRLRVETYWEWGGGGLFYASGVKAIMWGIVMVSLGGVTLAIVRSLDEKQ